MLACGDEGLGKLIDIADIYHLVTSVKKVIIDSGKKVLITTGATIAPLDQVRYLTNPSSGKTGFYLAKEALLKGYFVEVIAGLYSTELLEHLVHHPNFSLKRVGTVKEMEKAVHSSFKNCDIYISSAAISDIEFNTQNIKIKKSDLSTSLPILKSNDILKSVIDMKEDHQKIVGFAAESELTDIVLNEKMLRKPVDVLVATKVNSGQVDENETAGFRNDSAEYRILKKDSMNSQTQITMLSKNQMATTLFNDHL